MKDRIIQFLASEEISPAEFADKIGVQRSSMSHIINGRNFPSAAFIQKMLQAYTALNPRWLLIGDGNMYMNQEIAVHHISKPARTENSDIKQDHSPIVSGIQSTIQFSEKGETNSTEHESQPIRASRVDTKLADDVQKQSSILSSLNNIPLEAKDIEQILFFFKDKTFSIYRPS
ncbi:MAG: helix-turn-helix transcriptional regulator [Prolixibacteraceae bacterium]